MDQNERMKYIDGSKGGGVPCCFSTVLSFDSFLRPSVLNAAFFLSLSLSFLFPFISFSFKYPFSWERETREMYKMETPHTVDLSVSLPRLPSASLVRFSYVFQQQQQQRRQQLENDRFVPRQTEPPEFVTNEAIACAVRRRCTPFLITQVRVQLDSSSSSTYDGRAQRRLRS